MGKWIGGAFAAVWGSAILVCSAYEFFTGALNIQTMYGAVTLVGMLFGALALGVGVYELASVRPAARPGQ